jgi:heme-degrading monooxygenase HmoA
VVTIGMNYEVLPGKEGLFEEKFRSVIESFDTDAGHRASWLYRDVDAPGRYLIHSEWESRDAFLKFIRSDAFREVTNWGKERILAGRPRHRIYSAEELEAGRPAGDRVSP